MNGMLQCLALKRYEHDDIPPVTYLRSFGFLFRLSTLSACFDASHYCICSNESVMIGRFGFKMDLVVIDGYRIVDQLGQGPFFDLQCHLFAR